MIFMGARLVVPSDDPIVRCPTFNLNAYIVTAAGAEKLLDLILTDLAGLSTVDVMINRIQHKILSSTLGDERFIWYAWNGARFPDPLVTATPWIADRNMGLVFQNPSLGSEVDGWGIRA